MVYWNSMVSVGAEKTPDFAGRCMALVMEMLKLPAQHIWLDYDKEADVLYVSFRKPQRATETIELNDEEVMKASVDGNRDHILRGIQAGRCVLRGWFEFHILSLHSCRLSKSNVGWE